MVLKILISSVVLFLIGGTNSRKYFTTAIMCTIATARHFHRSLKFVSKAGAYHRSAMTLSIMSLSIMTLSMEELFATLSTNDTLLHSARMTLSIRTLWN